MPAHRTILAVCAVASFAWLLWEKTTYVTIPERFAWKRMEAFESKDQCVAAGKTALRRALEGETGAPWEVGRKEGQFKYLGANGIVNLFIAGANLEHVASWLTNYECWPETVDPRR